MRRGSTLLVVAALVLVGPVPMSLCAAMADLPADCAPPPQHCAGMQTSQPDATLTAPERDCCQVSSAPLPERSTTAPAPVASVAPVAPHEAALSAQPAAYPAPVETAARSAPADFQSVLCVFLI